MTMLRRVVEDDGMTRRQERLLKQRLFLSTRQQRYEAANDTTKRRRNRAGQYVLEYQLRSVRERGSGGGERAEADARWGLSRSTTSIFKPPVSWKTPEMEKTCNMRACQGGFYESERCRFGVAAEDYQKIVKDVQMAKHR
ncbi:hypothetical protein L915_21552 [Phytophthora nicotianae]|uniref:Uncharacterized protein n=1 Tax=Phytophthora nicotianae TaxID=4792 RepID=W2FK03_PHYNI|nr:hypothetical protein L915_21552 [Phytophthora nicotianae]